MERKIGEIFEYNGEWHQCVKGNGCEKCIFNKKKCYTFISDDDPIGYCEADKREDKQDVIFKKLEKVGEPYIAKNSIIGERLFQKYKLYKKDFIINEKNLLFTNFENTVGIEIKQNKEDMEEKAIKIKKEDIEVGNKVTCLSSNRPYVIAEANCRMKYDGDWHDCVIYTPLYDNPFKCFVRPVEDFVQNFVLDSVEEKKEKHSNLESTGKNLKPLNLEAAKAGKPVCTRVVKRQGLFALIRWIIR